MVVSMRCCRRWCRAVLAAAFAGLLLGGWPALVHAHKASDAFLEMEPAGDAVVVRWDIALRDLDQVLDLDLDAQRHPRVGRDRGAAGRHS